MCYLLSVLEPQRIQTRAEPCAYCLSLCDLTRALVLLGLEGLVSLMSSIPLRLLVFLPSMGSLSPEGRDFMEVSHLGLSVNKYVENKLQKMRGDLSSKGQQETYTRK